MTINSKIRELDISICETIDKLHMERGLLSQNILARLRTFTEFINLKVYIEEKKINIINVNDAKNDIDAANKYVKSRGNLKFLWKLHSYLQISVSHNDYDKENSESLMLKYCEYLLKIKKFLKKNYNIDVLYNINKLLNNTESNLKEYYQKILKKLLENKTVESNNNFDKICYIEKIKPFFSENEIFYEVTFIEARDWTSKFDRVIAFTKHEILKNYSVKLSIRNSNIDIINKIMPISIIDSWEVSIRPCEINNFGVIFGKYLKISRSNKEYYEIMKFLTKTGFNLLNIIELDEEYYIKYKDKILKNINKNKIEIFNLLDICRDFIKKNLKGANIIRYLLYQMNNKIIKQQTSKESCDRLSNLFLKMGCKPFDDIPFSFALKDHNPKISDLFECIDTKDREHEFLAHFIKNNADNKGKIFNLISEFKGSLKPLNLIEKYNKSLYKTFKDRQIIKKYKEYLYIEEYASNTVNIIKKLKEYSLLGTRDYTSSIVSWLKSNNSLKIDSNQKKEILKQMFENSKVAFIYGPAGTGKSTLINYISYFFKNSKKLYLANTNPAIENLKRKVMVSDSDLNCEFMTIFKFLNKKNFEKKYDLLVIDECSCVNNKDMFNILINATFEFLILVGDLYQIESILFGNWFNIAKKFIPKKSIFELTDQYRTNNKELLEFWNKVRNHNEMIIEHIVKNNYFKTLDNSIFVKENDDEIILCLNYDGLYGINNLNKFLQENNPSLPIRWGLKTYKIGDPVLFNESNRFAPLIYNNLKGKIVNIEIIDEKIQFDVEIDIIINEFQANNVGLKLIGKSLNNNSIVQFLVDEYKDNSDDDEYNELGNIIPFQIAYAISIHKAQGLEYNSVKIVITDEIYELITHNLFYTAITRTKEKLKIYWTPDTQDKIIKNFSKKTNNIDYRLLSTKYNLPFEE